MNGVNVSQFATLLISVSLVIVGYLGFVGKITASRYLLIALIIAIAVLAFLVGRKSAQLDHSISD